MDSGNNGLIFDASNPDRSLTIVNETIKIKKTKLTFVCYYLCTERIQHLQTKRSGCFSGKKRQK